MNAIHAENALLPDGLAADVRIIVSGGRIGSVEAGVPHRPGDQRCRFVMPAMANVHSHAFQRAMAGLAEMRGPEDDNFWSWRTIMYRFALSMSPDHVEAVTAQLYMEMLEAGFSRVGEFHYLHHDRDGAAYADPAEMAARVAAAAGKTGIGLTLLPVYYAHSDFGGAEPVPGQRRFICGIDTYAALVEASAVTLADLPGAVLGIAPHSLRAVTPNELAAIAPLGVDRPIHIHAAEQVREVEGCVAWSGKRPVEWLLDHADIDRRWCLIHATHMTDGEVRRMARSGAVAGLCPITEANLGDGIFPAPSFLEHGGAFGVGSDSNVQVSLSQELRSLEYGQRLSRRQRNVIAPPGGSTGISLYRRALDGGFRAVGGVRGIEAGQSADLVSLDISQTPWLPAGRVVDHFIFADGVTVDGVWVRGRRLVENGRHVNRDAISRRFRSVMLDLAEGAEG